MKHRLLGEILKEDGLLSEERLFEALEVQREKGGRIGEILLQKGAIREEDLLKALGEQYGLAILPGISLDGLDTDFTHHIPIQFLKNTRWCRLFLMRMYMLQLTTLCYFSRLMIFG